LKGSKSPGGQAVLERDKPLFSFVETLEGSCIPSVGWFATPTKGMQGSPAEGNRGSNSAGNGGLERGGTVKAVPRRERRKPWRVEAQESIGAVQVGGNTADGQRILTRSKALKAALVAGDSSWSDDKRAGTVGRRNCCVRGEGSGG
jgi:hypothetical protein